MLADGSIVQRGRAFSSAGDGQPLIRALLVGSRANFYSAIELRWRKLDGVGLSARGRERETSRKGAAPAAAGAESARQVPCPAWAEPD